MGTWIREEALQAVRGQLVDQFVEHVFVEARVTGIVSQISRRCTKLAVQILELVFGVGSGPGEERATVENVSVVNLQRKKKRHTLEGLLRETMVSCKKFRGHICGATSGGWNREMWYSQQRRVNSVQRYWQVFGGGILSRREPRSGGKTGRVGRTVGRTQGHLRRLPTPRRHPCGRGSHKNPGLGEPLGV